MTITTTCPICGVSQVIVVGEADYEAWKSGTYIQDAFPYLSADQREALMTGFCSTCWAALFPDD